MGQNRKAIMVPRRFSWVSKGEGPRRWRSNRRISDGCGGVVKAVRGDEARDTGVGGVRGSDEYLFSYFWLNLDSNTNNINHVG